MKGQAAAGGGGERASKRVAGGDAEAAQRRSGRIANDGSITTVLSMFVLEEAS